MKEGNPSAGVFLLGMSRASLLPPAFVSSAVHGSAQLILEIPTGTPAWRKYRNEARKKRATRKIVHSWKRAKPFFERWRKNLAIVQVKLKRPRLIDVVPIDFVGGEPVEREKNPTSRFRGQLIYFTKDDVTVRRPSGAILVVDTYEIIFISDGKIRLELT